MEIVIYTTDTCPHCHTAKQYLKTKNIPFLERNASRDPQAQAEMQANGMMGVPSFKINGQVMVGFNPQEIERLMKLQVVKCPNCSKGLRFPADKGRLKVTCPACHHDFTV